MNKQEFEQRYGKEVSPDVFEKICNIYMKAGNLDKDTFVKDFKAHKDSVLLETFFTKSEAQSRKINFLQEITKSLIDLMIKKGSEYRDEEILFAIEEQIGKKETIKRKIALHLELEEDDLDYINEHLA